jgi:hypothetical protein
LALFYGAEVPAGTSNCFPAYDDIVLVEVNGKSYIGKVISLKNAFRDCEVVDIAKQEYLWHPRFVAYFQESIRKYSSVRDYLANVELISFEKMKVKD